MPVAPASDRFTDYWHQPREGVIVKSRNILGTLFVMTVALAVSVPAVAVDVSHKDEVLKLTQQALEQGNQGNSAALVEKAKEAQRLAYSSLKERHSFIMQAASERLQRAVADGEKGQTAAANRSLEEVINDITAVGKDSMTP